MELNFATVCGKITGAGLACGYSLGSSRLVDIFIFVRTNRFSSDVVAYWLFYIIDVNTLNAPSASNFDAA